MIRLTESPRRWIGLSTDAKPIPGQAQNGGTDIVQAADVTVGTTFFETDTNRTATWNGASWVAAPVADDAMLQQLRTNGDELFRIRKLLEDANPNGLTSDDLI
jgi:hypothetical protein